MSEPTKRLMLHLPRWPRICLILALIDLACLALAWWTRGFASSAFLRIEALLAIVLFVWFLLLCFAWVVAIAFFGRERPLQGIVVCALLLSQLACLLGVLALAAH
jgi:hypothetical protein